jgi:hypothetical protein
MLERCPRRAFVDGRIRSSPQAAMLGADPGFRALEHYDSSLFT